jgi:hypothetical protein
MASTKNRARERAAEMRAEQERHDRRRRNLIFGGATVAIVSVVGGLTWLGIHGQSSSTASTTIDGLQTYTDLARDHVTGTVAYPQSPPVGGKHAAVWQNCGWYDTTVANENAVHAMEHGAAWVTYSDSLSADQKAKLKSELAGRSYVLTSEYAGLSAPVVVNAWGAQVKLTGIDDARLTAFLDIYANSAKAPEPGGECTGGTGTPS